MCDAVWFARMGWFCFSMTKLAFNCVLVSVPSRFCFFHAFFETKKKTSQILEANILPSEPLDEQTHSVVESYFFG